MFPNKSGFLWSWGCASRTCVFSEKLAKKSVLTNLMMPIKMHTGAWFHALLGDCVGVLSDVDLSTYPWKSPALVWLQIHCRLNLFPYLCPQRSFFGADSACWFLVGCSGCVWDVASQLDAHFSRMLLDVLCPTWWQQKWYHYMIVCDSLSRVIQVDTLLLLKSIRFSVSLRIPTFIACV